MSISDDNTPATDKKSNQNKKQVPLDKLGYLPSKADLYDHMPEWLREQMPPLEEKDYIRPPNTYEEYLARQAEEEKNNPTPKPPEPALGEMKEMLEYLDMTGTLDGDGHDLLHAQAQMLNNMFARTLHRATDNSYVDDNYMTLALKIQKQCADTLRIKGALRYMKSLEAPSLPPPSPKIVERTEFE